MRSFLLTKNMFDMLVIPRFGGGGGADVNQTTASQQALWGQYAKDWNTFLAEVEPRTEAAYKKAAALPETQSQVTNQMRLGALDKFNPAQTLANPQSLTTNMMRSNVGMGSALAGANLKGTEAAKDYQSTLLGNILASKMGAKTSTQSALSNFASNEASNYVQNLDANQKMNQAMSNAGVSGVAGIGYNLYQGANKANTGVKQ